MDTNLVTRAADRLRVRVDLDMAGPGRSGSGVYHAEREDGTACVRKISSRTSTLLDHVVDEGSIVLLLSAHGTVDPPVDGGIWSCQALARDLARPHRSEIPADRWRPTNSPWHVLENPDVEMIEAFWRADFPRDLDAIVENRLLLEQQIANGGEAFLHGDSAAPDAATSGACRRAEHPHLRVAALRRVRYSDQHSASSEPSPTVGGPVDGSLHHR